jgi:hypothetical protein
MVKTDSKSGDWFAELDAELEKKTVESMKEVVETNTLRSELNKTLIEDFWRIWIRFNKITVHFTIEPEYSSFAKFDEFPNGWNFKEDFDFATVKNITLTDRTQDQGRVGDSVKAWYYAVESKVHVRIVFEYCEGEHYYKYAGWKRIFSQFVLYDSPTDAVDMKKLHDMLADVVKVWYDSHLRRERDILLKHMKDKYPKGETFTQ